MMHKRNLIQPENQPGSPWVRSLQSRRERGQTIIVALIVLGILLILGLVFLGIISRSVGDSSRLQTRSLANDLAESGIRYAHNQLLTSSDGADWRGNLTLPIAEVGNPSFSRDPDAGYLRPGSGLALSSGAADTGGPDGLGPWVRVNFDGGRALVRVRYAPSDANIFASSPAGALRDPGALRNYLIIESIGRPGRVDVNDPTTLLSNNSIQFQNFASTAQLEASLGSFGKLASNVNAKKLTAFAAIGITEHARTITNKDKVSRPAEIGIPSNLGVLYFTEGGSPVTVGDVLTQQLGTDTIENVVGTSKVYGIGGLGSFHSNADIALYGQLTLFANVSMGDNFSVAGTITGTSGSVLRVNRREYQRRTQTWLPNEVYNLSGGGNLESRSESFTTAKGVVKDNVARTDGDGYNRGVGYEAPPLFSAIDPQTGENRYVQLTKASGRAEGGPNSGQFGYGSGTFVDNASDRQTPRTETGRAGNPGTDSLTFDWLNPNHPDSKYWVGPYYMPPGAQIEFRPDGFLITRDSRAPVAERFWRTPAGASTNVRTIRYRLGRASNRKLYVVNSFTPGIASIDGNLGVSDFDRGVPFNGVIYAQGNVRVRGIIPTDVQITLVSDATAYIEGSITKGITGNQWTATYNPVLGDPEAPLVIGTKMDRPSRSLLGIMARDYVALNTTMFFGPAGSENAEAVRDQQAMKIAQDGSISLQQEFVQGPSTAVDTYKPNNWKPYAVQYRDAVTNDPLNVQLLLSHAMEDGAADRSFIGLSINPNVFDSPTVVSPYLFPNSADNAASPAFEPTNPPYVPVWGLGIENYQRSPKFESIAFPIVTALTATYTTPIISATGNEGSYKLFDQGTNIFQISPSQLNGVPSNDYLLARASVAPHDIRVEAMIYAEQGSFYVIPGPWFNENANDRRDTYLARVADLKANGQTDAQARAIADDERLQNFGAKPAIPFYGEPVDVRVSVVGAVAENMPPSMGEQTAWLRKWGWIPVKLGATSANIPASHVPNGTNLATTPVVPNLIFSYDPVLGSGRSNGFATIENDRLILRNDTSGRPLPPLPRLPVSPSLSYFGELN